MTGHAPVSQRHWLKLHISAAVLVVVVGFSVYGVLNMAGAQYEEAHEWLRMPMNAGLSILFLAALFYHGILGARVIITDYVASEKLAALLSLTLKGISFLAFLAALGAALFVR